MLEIGVLKSLKKIYEGIGVLPECVLEMLHKNFAKLKSCFTLYIFKFRNNYFSGNALSGCFWTILSHQKLHYQISCFVSKFFLKVIQAEQMFEVNNKNNQLIC